jgi:hypothetical protein
MTDKKITPEIAEALGMVSAQISEALMKAGDQYENLLDWSDLVLAAFLGARGFTAVECERDKGLSLAQAKAMLVHQFMQSLAMPERAWQVVKTADKTVPSAGIIPIRRH